MSQTLSARLSSRPVDWRKEHLKHFGPIHDTGVVRARDGCDEAYILPTGRPATGRAKIIRFSFCRPHSSTD